MLIITTQHLMILKLSDEMSINVTVIEFWGKHLQSTGYCPNLNPIWYFLFLSFKMDFDTCPSLSK